MQVETFFNLGVRSKKDVSPSRDQEQHVKSEVHNDFGLSASLLFLVLDASFLFGPASRAAPSYHEASRRSAFVLPVRSRCYKLQEPNTAFQLFMVHQ
jgi:hypothetical protein